MKSNVFDFSLAIYNIVSPQDHSPTINVPESVQKVDIKDSAVVAYLNAVDQKALDELNVIFSSAFQAIIADNIISISDIPVFIKLVKDVSQKMNEFTERNTGIKEVSKLSIISFLRVVTVIVCQMLLPKTEFDTAFQILDLCFDLLQMEIIPVCQQWGLFNSCLPKK
jgi:hypothetical protein